MISQDALKNKDYINGYKYISVSQNFMACLQLINGVRQNVQMNINEFNLFVFRLVLIKVMFKQVESAKKIVKFMEKDWKDEVFIGYLRLLFQVIDEFQRQENKQCQYEFKYLQQKYDGLLGLDVHLKDIVKQIGYNVFKIQKE